MKKRPESQFTYIIYEKLKRELADDEDEISPARAKKIIIKALSLLPHVHVENSSKPDAVIVQSLTAPGVSMELHIQNAIDSILILWNERIRIKDAS